MRLDIQGFSTAEALLYLCASRCSLGRLSRVLVGATIAAGLAGAIVLFIAG